MITGGDIAREASRKTFTMIERTDPATRKRVFTPVIDGNSLTEPTPDYEAANAILLSRWRNHAGAKVWQIHDMDTDTHIFVMRGGE